MVRGLPAADVERAIAHASAGRLVTLMILTHVLRLLQGRKLPGSILGSSVLSLLELELIGVFGFPFSLICLVAFFPPHFEVEAPGVHVEAPGVRDGVSADIGGQCATCATSL